MFCNADLSLTLKSHCKTHSEEAIWILSTHPSKSIWLWDGIRVEALKLKLKFCVWIFCLFWTIPLPEPKGIWSDWLMLFVYFMENLMTFSLAVYKFIFLTCVVFQFQNNFSKNLFRIEAQNMNLTRDFTLLQLEIRSNLEISHSTREIILNKIRYWLF